MAYEQCFREDPTMVYVCTRRRGHAGPHMATGIDYPEDRHEEDWDRVCDDWPNEADAAGFAIPCAAPVTLKKKPALVISELPPELALTEHEGYANRTHVMLIGAGGVGARLAPILVKHLIPGDALSIIDHDLVETKNLLRQHFVSEDVGKAKALVVAERAQLAAPAHDIHIHGYQMKVEGPQSLAALDPRMSNEFAAWSRVDQINGRQVSMRYVVISAIDSRRGRRDVAAAVSHMREYSDSVAWIDCGNDMFSGQALVGHIHAAMDVREVGQSAAYHRQCTFDGWKELAPSFLNTPDEADTADPCAVRIDTQTVMANAWASLAASTLAVPFITGAPITSLGISFSIRSGGTKTVGVKRVAIDTYAYRIEPSGLLLA
jgi:hypothetical protein